MQFCGQMRSRGGSRYPLPMSPGLDGRNLQRPAAIMHSSIIYIKS